eukprot:1353025-Amphidinium_carterae.1
MYVCGSRWRGILTLDRWKDGGQPCSQLTGRTRVVLMQSQPVRASKHRDQGFLALPLQSSWRVDP